LGFKKLVEKNDKKIKVVILSRVAVKEVFFYVSPGTKNWIML
jgi:hypothetical protein